MKYNILRIITAICLLMSSVLVCSCGKEQPVEEDPGLKDSIWIPTYSKGEKDLSGYLLRWDGEVRPGGSITGTYEIDGEEVPYTFHFPSFFFYQEAGEDYYVRFTGIEPLDVDFVARVKYYIEDDILYLEETRRPGEMPDPLSPEFQAWADQAPVPSGEYIHMVIEERTPDRMVLDGTTYEKRKKQ